MNANEYTQKLNLSQQMGHVMNLQGKLYVTVAGLRVLAQRAGVQSIKVSPVEAWCAPDKGLFYVQATVVMPDNRVFTEYGSSHGSKVGGRGGNHALLGHASTRATGRALRNALDIALPLFEESGIDPATVRQTQAPPRKEKQKAFSQAYEDLLQQMMKAGTETVLQGVAASIGTHNLHPVELQELRRAYRVKKESLQEDLQVVKNKALAAYFATLQKSPWNKACSDRAIKSAYNVDSHTDLVVAQIQHMTKQADRDAYTGPPLSQTPGDRSMFQCHLEWARQGLEQTEDKPAKKKATAKVKKA